MKLGDKATVFIAVAIITFLALEFYAATGSANNIPEGTMQRSSVTTPETTETEDDSPLFGIDIGLDIESATFAWLILAVVIGAPVGYGVYKNLDAIADRIRGKEEQQKPE
ncbi:hypothetical protein KJA17_02395 [Patescibacteria group bacterium]|nr:hypothetical protein [Patescibacteria group bacterium]